MDFAPYSEYFENLARRLKDIGHTPEQPKFCRFNIEEVLDGLATDLDLSTPVLLLESFEGHLNDNGGDQVFDGQDAAFLIMQDCDLTDFVAQNAIIDLAKRIGLKIIARLRKDARQRLPGALPVFDLNKVNYQKVGPVFGNAYGYRFTFGWDEPISVVVNEADWLPA